MLLDAFRRRFAYHGWASSALADAVADEERHAPARRALAHAFTADRVWLLRLRGEPTEALALWPELAADGLRALARRNAAAYATYLDGLTSGYLARPIAYRNSKGDAYETAISDVLDHVLLHGAYHRGQAAAALRAAGDAPPPTDFIVWLRAKSDVS